MKARALFITGAVVSLFGCASVDVTEEVRSKPLAEATGSFGFITPTGVVVNKNKANTISYDGFVGEDCVKHLKAMTGFEMLKIEDSQCNAQGFHNPYTAASCSQYAQEKVRRQQKDQICLRRQQTYEAQTLTMRIVQPGMTADFADRMPNIAQAPKDALIL